MAGRDTENTEVSTTDSNLTLGEGGWSQENVKESVAGAIGGLALRSSNDGNKGGSYFEKKKAFVLEERARALVTQSKFYEAASLLEEIGSVTKDTELGVKLLMAECYMQLGRENKANKAIEAIRNIILTPSGVNFEDVIALGEAYEAETSVVRPLILFRIASEMITSTSLSPDEKVDGIARCIALSRKAIDSANESGKSSDKEEGGIGGLLKNAQSGGGGIGGFMKSLLDPQILAMIGADGGINASKLLGNVTESNKDATSGRLRVIVLDFGIEYMKEMLKDLRSVKGANPERQALKDAWSATHIGFNLASLGEFTKSYKIRKAGADAMEKVFGAQAGMHKVYGLILHNMGVVLHNTQKYAEALKVYERSLKAKDMALDYDENEKQKDIEVTSKAIRNTRRHMK